MASIASALSSQTNTATATSSTSTSTAATDALGNEQTFLQLLVSEIKNQDPTAPMDSTTFLTQLAQFSQLEQTAGIRQDIENGTYKSPTSTASTSSTSATATTSDTAATLAAATTRSSLANTAAQDLSNTASTTPASTSGI